MGLSCLKLLLKFAALPSVTLYQTNWHKISSGMGMWSGYGVVTPADDSNGYGVVSSLARDFELQVSLRICFTTVLS